MAIEKLKNPYNSFEEITEKINEIIEQGGQSFTPTENQLTAMNSGINESKVAQIQTNKENIENIIAGFANYLDFQTVSNYDDIITRFKVPINGSKDGYIVRLTPVQTAGATKASGFIKVSNRSADNALIEFYPYDNPIKWTIIKNNGTWGSWKSQYDYMYPIGHIIFNNGTDPSTQFGGTWTLYSTGGKALYLDSEAGINVEEELPNVNASVVVPKRKASSTSGTYDVLVDPQGAFEVENAPNDSPLRYVEGAQETERQRLKLNLSKHNSVYKDNGKVKADGITVCAWVRTA